MPNAWLVLAAAAAAAGGLAVQEVYSKPEAARSFDAVVTCFFIDTAHNILQYLEVRGLGHGDAPRELLSD
jgi:hypothetical protein